MDLLITSLWCPNSEKLPLSEVCKLLCFSSLHDICGRIFFFRIEFMTFNYCNDRWWTMKCCLHAGSILNLWFTAAAAAQHTAVEMQTAVFTLEEAGVLTVGAVRVVAGQRVTGTWLTIELLTPRLSGNSLFLNQQPSLMSGFVREDDLTSRTCWFIYVLCVFYSFITDLKKLNQFSGPNTVWKTEQYEDVQNLWAEVALNIPDLLAWGQTKCSAHPVWVDLILQVWHCLHFERFWQGGE